MTKESAKRTKVIISSVSALKDSVVNPEGKLRNGIQNPRKPAGIPQDGAWWIEKLRRGT